jgi:hypothetical protein
MRTIELKDNKIVAILRERAEVFKEVGVINEKLVELDKERKKKAYLMDRLRDKLKPFLNKLESSFELGEFEIISNIKLNKKGYPEVDIVDRIEEFKTALREEAKKDK